MLPFAALVIGSTVPDLCLFLPFRVERLYHHAHGLRGLVTVNLAPGLTIYAAWRLILAAPARDLLPDALRRRVPPAPPLRVAFSAVAAVAAALVLGAATHVFWDTFTHRHRWGTDAFPDAFYAGVALPGLGTPWPVYKLFQYGSSLVGLPLLALWTARTLWQAPIHAVAPGFTIPSGARWAVWLGLALLPVAATASVFGARDAGLAWRLHHSATRTGAAVAMALALYAGVWHAARHRPARPTSAETR